MGAICIYIMFGAIAVLAFTDAIIQIIRLNYKLDELKFVNKHPTYIKLLELRKKKYNEYMNFIEKEINPLQKEIDDCIYELELLSDKSKAHVIKQIDSLSENLENKKKEIEPMKNEISDLDEQLYSYWEGHELFNEL